MIVRFEGVFGPLMWSIEIEGIEETHRKHVCIAYLYHLTGERPVTPAGEKSTSLPSDGYHSQSHHEKDHISVTDQALFKWKAKVKMTYGNRPGVENI